jgi:[ribosomal protein S18]-alanine N-acetyltransferase
VIRPAQRSDIPQVLDIETACYSTPWSERAFQTLLERDYVLFRVVENEQPDDAPEPHLAGFGVLWWGGRDAELANLAVHPEHQGKGFGGVLLDGLLAEAELRGVREVFLEVRESNAHAQALYQSRGFVPVGRRRRYYQKPDEDALVLALALAPPDEAP